MPANEAETIRMIAAEVIAAAVTEGVHPRVATKIGQHVESRIAAGHLRTEWAPRAAAHERRALILAKFNGRNARELMTEFGISKTTFYRYLSDH
jgi:DNA invertase Pin-like site-specific DNA recombinase